MTVTVRQMFEANREALQLRWIAGEAGGSRDIAPTRAAPADLLGYLNLIHPSRMHVFGQAETAYYLHLDESRRRAILDDVVSGNPPAVIVSEGIEPDPGLVSRCRAANLPLLSSGLPGARIIDTHQPRRLRRRDHLRGTAPTQRISPRHRDFISQPRQPDTVQPVRHAPPMQSKARANRLARPLDRRHPPG